MKTSLSILLLLSLTLNSCLDKICDPCSVTPIKVSILLYNKRYNLISKGIIDASKIKLFKENGDEIALNIKKIQKTGKINLYDISYYTGINNYSLYLGNNQNINIRMNIGRENTECCNNFRLIDFEICDYKYSVNKTTLCYSIILRTKNT